MKKILMALMALSIVCAGVAMAEETKNTQLTYTVTEPPSEYSVIIPASAAFTQESATLEISIGKDSWLATGDELTIKLAGSANDFALKHISDAQTIPYTIRNGGVPVRAGGTVLSWKSAEEMPSAVTLELTADITGDEPKGDYKDTLTFNISLDGDNL